MIRLKKPVQLLEWGEGSNTTNQQWIELGKGNIVEKPKVVNGVTTLRIQLDKKAVKQNPEDDAIKITQLGEGMTANSPSFWGEVAFGRLKQMDSSGTMAEIEIKFAVKVGN